MINIYAYFTSSRWFFSIQLMFNVEVRNLSVLFHYIYGKVTISILNTPVVYLIFFIFVCLFLKYNAYYLYTIIRHSIEEGYHQKCLDKVKIFSLLKELGYGVRLPNIFYILLSFQINLWKRRLSAAKISRALCEEIYANCKIIMWLTFLPTLPLLNDSSVTD